MIRLPAVPELGIYPPLATSMNAVTIVGILSLSVSIFESVMGVVAPALTCWCWYTCTAILRRT